MFSKALFKQSCKANGVMWTIITFAVCFMLACVMLITGNGGIGDTKNAIEDTIIVKEIDASIEKRALSYYQISMDGLTEFDKLEAKNIKDSLTYLVSMSTWNASMPNRNNFSSDQEYLLAMKTWSENQPQADNKASLTLVESYTKWNNEKPVLDNFSSEEEYNLALQEWNKSNPMSQVGAVSSATMVSIEEIQEYMYEYALNINSNYTKDTTEAKEILGVVMYSIVPDQIEGFDDEFYTKNNEIKPESYDYASIAQHIASNDIDEYLISKERQNYLKDRSQECNSIFLASNLSKDETVKIMVNELSSFGVTQEKYDSFGYNYSSIKHMSVTSIITFRNRLDYEIGLLDTKLNNNEITLEEYNKQVNSTTESLVSEISSSLLSSLPSEVSDALQEVGQLDLFSLVVGSIFYKLAGLLLPIIFMIMASNNLISGQVDSGSMAYVLSTSTKRRTVVFTQAIYLIGSLFCMFSLTTITGCVCLSLIKADVDLTYTKLIYLNLGAFFVLFCLSGLCFLTSCWFDRSKRSMAIGGGLSIFALVAAMLGLFGSQVIPSVVRLDSLNYFNWATIISLFDVISIIDGTNTFIYKYAILFVLGLIGYIIGSERFVKKDLPL